MATAGLFSYAASRIDEPLNIMVAACATTAALT
jgi:hypothetical protein